MYSISASSVRRNRVQSPRQLNASTTFGELQRRRPFRCYMPFMWQQCLLSGIGLLIFVAGIAMAIVGMYAELELNGASSQASPSLVLAVSSSITSSTSTIGGRKVFTYLGPVVMSIGCFLLIVSCTVVCETRDKMVAMLNNGKSPQQLPEPNFHEMVVQSLVTKWQKKRRKELLKELQGDDKVDDTAYSEVLAAAFDTDV